MEYIEFSKKKQSVFLFVLIFLIKYQGEYLTSILWAVFLFITPAVILLIAIMIV